MVALVGFEALLALAGAAYEVRGLLVSRATEPGAAVALAASALLLAVALVLGARGLLAGRRGVRAPLLVWQVLQLAVGLPQFGGGTTWAGLLLSVPAALVLAGLFSRDVLPDPER
ncbi:hypothetical protein GCM10023225_06480 [Kineococcus glutinatus]|uniref:Integral membrane protein n=1 Tax=Kineococcus glutinatus TaxID=1070872 RepID=A0ABP9HB93_9ACTN